VIEDYPGWAAFYTVLVGPFRENFPTSGEDAVICEVFHNPILAWITS
jgi:hypothetical protein